MIWDPMDRIHHPLHVGEGDIGNYNHLAEIAIPDGLLDEERHEWTEEVHVAPILRPVVGEWGECDRDVAMLANEERFTDVMERRGMLPLAASSAVRRLTEVAIAEAATPRADALTLTWDFPNQQHIVWAGDDQAEAERVASAVASTHIAAFAAPHDGGWLVFAQRSEVATQAQQSAEEASAYWWPLDAAFDAA